MRFVDPAIIEELKAKAPDEKSQEPEQPPRVLTPEEEAEADRKAYEAVNREIKHMAVGCLCCSVVMCLLFASFRRFSMGVVWGALLGSAFALISFAYLGRSVHRSINMGAKGPMYLRRTYMVRLLINGAAVVLAAKLPFVNAIVGIAPLFFPGVTIFAMELLGMYRPK